MNVLGPYLILTLTAYTATLTTTITEPWAHKQYFFPATEWAALAGALLGMAAAIAIWHTLF